MNNRRFGLGCVLAVVVLALVFLCCCGALFASGVLGIMPWTRTSRTSTAGMSNGEQIFTTATSQRGTPIEFDIGGGMMMMRDVISCATCHGTDGRGREVTMMMRTFSTPDIRFKTLTSPRTNEQGEPEPIFSEATIKRAITQGVDPNGDPLAWPMPRWTMSDADLQDLVDYLQTLP